jgi:hypothetical protein
MGGHWNRRGHGERLCTTHVPYLEFLFFFFPRFQESLCSLRFALGVLCGSLFGLKSEVWSLESVFWLRLRRAVSSVFRF